MTDRALAGVADFILAAGQATGTSAMALAAGGAAAFGVLVFPTNAGAEGKWVHVGGPGDVSYFHNPDEIGVKLRYTTPDGVQHEIAPTAGPGGEFRDPKDGKVIAKWVKAGAKATLLVSTAALLGRDRDEPNLCLAPKPERGDTRRGREYEDYMKALFNPGNPTPSGMAYDFIDPKTGNNVSIDDCQQRFRAAAEYKGHQYEEHFLKDDPVWKGMLSKMDDQSLRQERATDGDGRELIWFFEGKHVAAFMRESLKDRESKIVVEHVAMPGDGDE